MSEGVISAAGLGKMYRMYRNPRDKVIDAFGLGRFMPWKQNYYKEFWALRDLNFEIGRGERVGLVGRNGAGKSTLLKIIAGNVAQTEGSIAIRGEVQALMELGTGFHPEFTGRENIRASLAYHGLNQDQIESRVDDIIDFAELDDFIDQPIKSYSAGMYARLAFSTATSIQPEVLIIDEVLGAGDAYFAGKCLERMRRLTSDHGVTVLFVSHDVSAVQQLCTRAIWIDQGTIVEDADTQSVVKSYYRSIQREEAMRRRAQSTGLRKLRSLQQMGQTLDHRALFHLVCDKPHPRGGHRIRRATLSRGGEALATLDFGAPMDNNVSAACAVLDDPGYMDWSAPRRDDKGRYRAYENRSGSYRHAPFEITVEAAGFPSSAWSLELEADIDAADTVRIELHWNDAYHALGDLRPGVASHRFTLPDLGPAVNDESARAVWADAAPSEPKSAPRVAASDATIVTWERPDPCIESVRFVDAAGNDVAGIEELEDLIVEIAYQSSRPIEGPVFSMSVLQANGTLFCHANTALAAMTIDRIEGGGVVRFTFPRFRGSEGDYMIGCSIFHYLDPANYAGQPPYYDQHDRAYRFKVWKRMDNRMSLGAARIEFETEHRPQAGGVTGHGRFNV
ncbi:MAG: ABC transporter ATP-binding protein [Burkholderiaceae bacterium]